MPWASAGLLSAQSARSTPASASARACATASWLLAIVGSMADSTEKPTMRAERISQAQERHRQGHAALASEGRHGRTGGPHERPHGHRLAMSVVTAAGFAMPAPPTPVIGR